MQDIPKWLHYKLDRAGFEKIKAAVGLAETRTRGEIVPMIVRKSITTGHVPVVLFLGTLLILWNLIPYASALAHGISVYAIESIAVVLAAVITWLLKDSSFWQRTLTSDSDEEASVFRRAQLEFFTSGIKATEGRTGVLILVSLVEHRAVILADEAIASKLPETTWQEVIKDMLFKIKDGDLAGGISDAIDKVGRLLQKDFPIQAGDKNELSNKLVIRE